MTDRRVSRRSLLSVGAAAGLAVVGSGALRTVGTDRTDRSGSVGGDCCEDCSSTRAELQSDGVEASDEGGNHWLAFGWTKHGAGFGRYESTLRVPCVPPVHDERVVFFYFPAFQSYSDDSDDADGYILQPVLAWNWGGSGRWEIGTWSGSSSHGFEHSELVPVSPGDRLRAVIQRPDSLPGRWYLEMRNRTTGDVAVSRSHRLDQRFRYAYLTLEANRTYDPGNCGFLPGGTMFEDITLTDWHGDRVSPDWHRRYDDSFDCDLAVDVRSADHVAIDTASEQPGETGETTDWPDGVDLPSWVRQW